MSRRLLSCSFLCFFLLCCLRQTCLVTTSTVGPPSEDGETGSNNQTDISPTSGGEYDAVQRGANFILSQRSPISYGWEQETHRAIITLALADALNLGDQQDLEQKLMIKELELKLSLALAKQHQEDLTGGQLALYINALLGVCHNPRDFYGLNLVSHLLHKIIRDTTPFSFPYSLQALALCNAGVIWKKYIQLRLIEFIQKDPSSEGGFIDGLAMTTLALACGQQSMSSDLLPMGPYLRHAVKKIKKSQKSDGSFGNIYSSGIALQALLMSKTNDKHWNRSLAFDYITSQQGEDGSFTNFMGTYFALPLLMNRTLASFYNWSCGNTSVTRDLPGLETTTSIPEGKEISVGVLVRAQEIQEYRVNLKAHENESLYLILKGNEESISVEFKEHSFGHMIVGIDGLNQDSAKNKYWIILIVEKNGSESFATTGVDGLFPQDGDNFVFELKAFY